MIQIPNDLIIMLSGVSCVGKTTVAYNLLQEIPQLRIVSELDIVRTMVRTAVKEISNLEFVQGGIEDKILHLYKPLYKSITNGNFQTLKDQSSIMLKYIKEIVKRQQIRKIPTVIEGINIVPSLYFFENEPIEGFQKDIVFINLYMSDIEDHKKRRQKRCKKREYTQSLQAIDAKITKLEEHNNMLHKETLALSNMYKNIFSFDVSNKSEKAVLSEIISFLAQLYH